MIPLRKSIGYIKCKAVGHDIFLEDEDKLFSEKSIVTRCSVCGKQVKATMNETNEDEYFVEEL